MSPIIGFTAIASYEAEEYFSEDEVIRFGFRDELTAAAKGLKEMQTRGIRILGGGDYGFGLTPHGTNARDLDHLIKYCDFTPMQAIISMTKDGGAAMDLGHELGQIKEGFLADLLVIDGNPLEDTLILLDHAKIEHVMKDGELIKTH